MRLQKAILEKYLNKWNKIVHENSSPSMNINEIQDIILDYLEKFQISHSGIKIQVCSSPMESYSLASLHNKKSEIDFILNKKLYKNFISQTKEFDSVISKLIEIKRWDDPYFRICKNQLLGTPLRQLRHIFDYHNYIYDNNVENFSLPSLDYLNQVELKFPYVKHQSRSSSFHAIELMYNDSFTFSEFISLDNIHFAAYYDFCLQLIIDKYEDEEILNDYPILLNLKQFIHSFKLNIFNILFAKDTQSSELLCFISRRPNQTSFLDNKPESINEPTFKLHNLSEPAITFSDGWSLNYVFGTHFNEFEFERFVLSSPSVSEINKMDFLSNHREILPTLRKLYKYKTPEIYEFWQWFSPDDEEWPEDATKEEEQWAFDRVNQELETPSVNQ